MEDVLDSRPKSRNAQGGRVTITQVAEATGLAKGTVSRALNAYPDISASTKQRVIATARALGYTPLTHAQAIKTGRVRAVGLVLQFNQHDAQAPFLDEFLAGVGQAVSRQGWTLTVATAVSEADGLAVFRRLIAERKADGFILPRSRRLDPRAKLLTAEGVPFVLFGRTADTTGAAWFDIRGEDAMAEGVARMVALGHRRIGFIGADPTYMYAHLREEGYRRGLAEAGIAFDQALVVGECLTSDAAEAAAAKLLDKDERPTAILCATDLLAIGAAQAARLRGLALGRDLSLIGYDGLPEGRMIEPRLATFAVDQPRAGARLAEMLLARIRGAAPETLRETVPATFRPGGTLGPAPTRL